MCGCTADSIEIIYRYTTKELERFEKSMEQAGRVRDEKND